MNRRMFAGRIFATTMRVTLAAVASSKILRSRPVA
jgi:hypothetical protein